MSKIIVIGSGFGGLAAAIRLAARGHEVEIFEKRDQLGGRAYVYEIDGFKFDGGPTVITAPFMFADLWAAAGKDRKDYFEFVPCDPYYRIFSPDGRAFNYNGKEEFILKQIEQWNPADKVGYQRFMATTKAIFQKGFVELADKPFLHFSDMLKVAPDLIKLQSYRSVYGYVSQFIKDDFLRQCFTFHPLLIGGNPFDSPSIYAMIHYLEREWGVHYALGGTGAIVAAMGRLFAELGGRVHLNAEVEEILVEQRRVTGIRLADGTIHRADQIVSNADAAFTYRKLIPAHFRHKYTDAKIDHMKYSMSLFVIYFGTKRQYRDQGLAHHNIILGQRYKELLRDIFDRHELADDFSLYLHMPSLTDPSVAPPGCESFYVLSPVPNLAGDIDWTTKAKPYRDAIMQFLEDNYLPDLQANIVAEHYIDPLHFQNVLNSHLGSAFSLQPTLTQSAWFRPHNRSEEFDNLYFVGAGTHPGAGLPGVLSSAIIADDLIGNPVRESDSSLDSGERSMTYAGFLLRFLAIPIVLLTLLLLRERRPLARGLAILFGLVVIAVVYTTPWDNYLVATGIWWYDLALVTGITLGWVPLEEYTFFVLQTVMTGLWFLLLTPRLAAKSKFAPRNSPRLISAAFVGLIWLASMLMLIACWLPGSYLALELAWALPPIALQLAVGADILWQHRRIVLTTILMATLYLSAADSFAIGSGTWTINPQRWLGLRIVGVLPLEEAIFFLITNTLLIFGLMLALAPESRDRLASLLPIQRFRRKLHSIS